MALPAVHIRKEAFLIMTWAAIETFKKECFGFLLGYPPTKRKNFFSITDAVSFQRVKRFNTRVDVYKGVERKFNKFISDISGVYPKYLGHFHSHPEWGDHLPSVDMSETDLRGFNKTPEPLEFIVGVSSRKKGQATWESLPDGDVKGSFDKFNLHFTVYTLVQESEEATIQKLRIVTPRSIKTLNRILVKK